MLVEQRKGLGVGARAALVVHCAFSRVAPIEGGPEALIAALATTCPRRVASRDIVDEALAHLLEDEAVFLHPARSGRSVCKEARKSMNSGSEP